ncbi:MAG: hypothetical protein J0I12_17725 [Candidatus Eremiobacteraeota bacterium]|nr:hypothetical protein [Candidatus Eremiobacteraeota bacterium]
MLSYSEFIAKTRLLRKPFHEFTSGDVPYNGTAMEVWAGSEELFHIVVDEQTGEKQILFFQTDQHWRMPLADLHAALQDAEEWVRMIPPPDELDMETSP